MVIFTGWSHSGKTCAEALKTFLLTCFPTHVDVKISEDISKGKDWRSELLGQLEGADYGILCLTRDSDSSWMCFEAGALACRKVPVAPLLINVSNNQVFSPLTGSQTTKFTMEDVRRLTDELYKMSGLKDWNGYDNTFPKAWKAFEADIQEYGRSHAYRLSDFEADLKELGKGVGDFDEWMMKRGGEVAAWLKHDTVPLVEKARKVDAFLDDLSKYEQTNGQYAVLWRKLENLVL